MATAILNGMQLTEWPRLAGTELLVLARVACDGGATRTEVARELATILVGARSAVDRAAADLTADGLVLEARSRVKPTPKGVATLSTELGGHPLPSDWPAMRDEALTARALGMANASPHRLKGLNRPDQLRAEVLARAFGLKAMPRSAARLRTQLAVVALERAFGNTIKGGLGSGRGLSPKASRLLAAQLLRSPRDPRTDQRLIAALAAEQAGAQDTDTESLRVALLRGLVAPADPRQAPPARRGTAPITPDRGLERPPEPSPRSGPPSRPNLEGFAREVQVAARGRAEGWAGMRKAFISHVWQAIAAKHPGWALSEVEFKAMLAEAHRTGHIALVNADLKDKSRIKELQASAVAYKNTVWHFVRIAE
jgi:hypothetical protein